jgi:hypothetical protein
MASEPKKQRIEKQEKSRKPMGAHAVDGKNVEPLSQTEGGSLRHSGRDVPNRTKNTALNAEVRDLSLAHGKKK